MEADWRDAAPSQGTPRMARLRQHWEEAGSVAADTLIANFRCPDQERTTSVLIHLASGTSSQQPQETDPEGSVSSRSPLKTALVLEFPFVGHWAQAGSSPCALPGGARPGIHPSLGPQDLASQSGRTVRALCFEVKAVCCELKALPSKI